MNGDEPHEEAELLLSAEVTGSLRRQSGISRRWFRRLNTDIRLGHLGAQAIECGAAIADVYDKTLMGVKLLSAIAIAIELI